MFKNAFFAAVTWVALLPATASAEIISYHVSKLSLYTQTAAAQAATPSSRLFTGILYYSPNEVLSAGIAFDVPPPTTVPMYLAALTTHVFTSSPHASQADLDLAYPSTTYTFTAELVTGLESADVFLPVDLYCPEIPYFTGDTYDRLQSYDFSQPFDATINGFTLPAGANVGATDVYVKDDGGATAFSISMAPGDTHVQIPAGLLLPFVNYSISVQYASLLRTGNAGFGTATSIAGFYRGTSVSFTTLPDAVPCPGDVNADRVVDLSDLATLLSHFGTQSGATLADGDLSGDGDVDLSDLALLLGNFGTTCP